MAKVKEDSINKGMFMFRCAGCKHLHSFNTNPANMNLVWGFNEDVDRPTVTGSLLYWDPTPEVNSRCHSLIKDGMIEFLGDCTHGLAGKTVELEDIK